MVKVTDQEGHYHREIHNINGFKVFFLSFQRQRECDRSDVLLQEGGSRSDRDALYGAQSYCGMYNVTH